MCRMHVENKNYSILLSEKDLIINAIMKMIHIPVIVTVLIFMLNRNATISIGKQNTIQLIARTARMLNAKPIRIIIEHIAANIHDNTQQTPPFIVNYDYSCSFSS